jgi:hypothetical protein
LSDSKTERDYAHHSRKQVMPAAGSLFRWVIAALVTVNGGALITLTQQTDDNFGFLRASGAYFGAGLIFVIMGGLLGFVVLFWLGSLMEDPEVRTDKDYKGPSERTVAILLALGIAAMALPVTSLAAFGIGGMKLIDTVDLKAAAAKRAKSQVKSPDQCQPAAIKRIVDARAHKSLS